MKNKPYYSFRSSFFLLLALNCSSCAIRYHRASSGVIENRALSEISGIVPSSFHQGMYWVHNDGGNLPYLYLIDTLGSIHGSVKISNAINRDWEDLAQGMNNGVSFLYVGDIGNNRKNRESVQIYKIEEPRELEGEMNTKAEVMNIHYTDGSRDAEALLYDPQSHELIIVTKRELRVHAYAFPFEPGNQTVAPYGKIKGMWITGGDINSKGEILLKNYGHVFYWSNRNEQSAVDRLTRSKGQKIAYRREPLGEAICWKPTGGFMTISERFRKKPVKVYQYILGNKP